LEFGIVSFSTPVAPERASSALRWTFDHSFGVSPVKYQRAVVVDGRGSKKNEKGHSSEWTAKYAQKEFDRASIVRDVR
jgi:hypothetical protein